MISGIVQKDRQSAIQVRLHSVSFLCRRIWLTTLFCLSAGLLSLWNWFQSLCSRVLKLAVCDIQSVDTAGWTPESVALILQDPSLDFHATLRTQPSLWICSFSNLKRQVTSDSGTSLANSLKQRPDWLRGRSKRYQHKEVLRDVTFQLSVTQPHPRFSYQRLSAVEVLFRTSSTFQSCSRLSLMSINGTLETDSDRLVRPCWVKLPTNVARLMAINRTGDVSLFFRLSAPKFPFDWFTLRTNLLDNSSYKLITIGTSLGSVKETSEHTTTEPTKTAVQTRFKYVLLRSLVHVFPIFGTLGILALSFFNLYWKDLGAPDQSAHLQLWQLEG